MARGLSIRTELQRPFFRPGMPAARQAEAHVAAQGGGFEKDVRVALSQAGDG